MDDDDQSWVDNQRRGYLRQAPPGAGVKDSSSVVQRPKPLPLSDAVLNCPACMTLLTLDCQRHEKYQHQYRAMFVSNCTIDTSEILRFPPTDPIESRRKNKKKKKKTFHNFEATASSVHLATAFMNVSANNGDSIQAESVSHDSGACRDSASINQPENYARSCEAAIPKDTIETSQVENVDVKTHGFNGAGLIDEGVYNPVRCSVCGTEVAVYDSDEVYHFFNVLSGYT